MLLGTLVHVALVLIGGFVGLFLKKGISKRFLDLIMYAIVLVTMVIGIKEIKVSNLLPALVIPVILLAFIG